MNLAVLCWAMNNYILHKLGSSIVLIVLFVRQERKVAGKNDMYPSLSHVVAVIRHVASVSEDSKVTIDTEEYVNSFTASMMEATFAWSNGASFCEVRALYRDVHINLLVFFRFHHLKNNDLA